MAFLHGIEHLNLPADFTPVNDVVTAVIGLVGTAEIGDINQLRLCLSAKDDAQFGEIGTIPEALRAIRLQDSNRGGAVVIVVKVADTGTELTPADIIGTVSGDGTRTGLKLFETALTAFGFEPMIYIVPRFSALPAVVAELVSITDKTEAVAYIDSPDGMTFNNAIAQRGSEGAWPIVGNGCKLLFPHFKVSNPAYVDVTTTPDIDPFLNIPMSSYCAGLRAKIDIEEGWHVSNSNHKINGVDGPDVDLTFGLGDQTCEVNTLNSKGVTTAVNMFGNGIMEWGNYLAGFPASADTDNFECVRRTRAIMKRAIEQACIPFIDKPFVQANVDAIRNTVNQYLNGLVARGAIVYGKCFYRPGSNPLSELALGHLTFDIEFTPALPMQRLTFTYKIDLTQLANIV
jgi:phage tail sheath protein FI